MHFSKKHATRPDRIDVNMEWHRIRQSRHKRQEDKTQDDKAQRDKKTRRQEARHEKTRNKKTSSKAQEFNIIDVMRIPKFKA
jgi:hypothetical protein